MSKAISHIIAKAMDQSLLASTWENMIEFKSEIELNTFVHNMKGMIIDKIPPMFVCDEGKEISLRYLLWKANSIYVIIDGTIVSDLKSVLLRCEITPMRVKRYNMSLGVEIITEYLASNSIPYRTEMRYEDCKFVNPLPFDVHINIDNKEALIEYDGRQHFELSLYSKDNRNLNIIQQRDIIKTEFCIDRGISLFRLAYDISEDSIESELQSFIDMVKRSDKAVYMFIDEEMYKDHYNLLYSKDLTRSQSHTINVSPSLDINGDVIPQLRDIRSDMRNRGEDVIAYTSCWNPIITKRSASSLALYLIEEHKRNQATSYSDIGRLNKSTIVKLILDSCRYGTCSYGLYFRFMLT